MQCEKWDWNLCWFSNYVAPKTDNDNLPIYIKISTFRSVRPKTVGVPSSQVTSQTSSIQMMLVMKAVRYASLMRIFYFWVSNPLVWSLGTMGTFLIFHTRKYLLRGYFLAPPGRRKRITLKFDQSVTWRYVTWRDVTITDIRTERRVRWNIILDYFKNLN